MYSLILASFIICQPSSSVAPQSTYESLQYVLQTERRLNNKTPIQKEEELLVG